MYVYAHLCLVCFLLRHHWQRLLRWFRRTTQCFDNSVGSTTLTSELLSVTVQCYNTMEYIPYAVTFITMIYLFRTWKPILPTSFTHFAHCPSAFHAGNQHIVKRIYGSVSAFWLFLVIYDNVDRPRRYYAMWNKSKKKHCMISLICTIQTTNEQTKPETYTHEYLFCFE